MRRFLISNTFLIKRIIYRKILEFEYSNDESTKYPPSAYYNRNLSNLAQELISNIPAAIFELPIEENIEATSFEPIL